MSKHPVALTGLVARKGQPAASAPEPEIPTAQPTVPRPAPQPVSRLPPAPKLGTIAVTVRLDPVRYERLKSEAAASRRTNQDIIVSALDVYLGGPE